MIVCSCTRLRRKEVEEVVRQVVIEDPWAVFSPGKIFHQCGRRIKCGRCCPLVLEVVEKQLTTSGHRSPVPKNS